MTSTNARRAGDSAGGPWWRERSTQSALAKIGPIPARMVIERLPCGKAQCVAWAVACGMSYHSVSSHGMIGPPGVSWPNPLFVQTVIHGAKHGSLVGTCPRIEHEPAVS
ncbi:MAG: hypothetical protein MI924_38780 [Chloroflexales bacterium]|nr:hypothetical protein [Chloroflexales bacterium]